MPPPSTTITIFITNNKKQQNVSLSKQSTLNFGYNLSNSSCSIKLKTSDKQTLERLKKNHLHYVIGWDSMQENLVLRENPSLFTFYQKKDRHIQSLNFCLHYLDLQRHYD